MQKLGLALAAAAVVTITAPASMRGVAALEDKAAAVLAATRKATGGRKLDGLKTMSVAAKLQRNVGNFQMSSDVELLLDLPDKYVRSDAAIGGPVAVNSTMGFNGDRAITRVDAPGGPGGGVIIRMGPAGPMGGPGSIGEKPTAEQQEQMNRAAVRNARVELSRLMLGWFGTVHPTVRAEYSYFGEAESPDGRAHVIDVKDDEGFAARLFIDQQTDLPLMVTYQAPQMRMSMNRMGGADGPQAPGAPGRQRGQLIDEERQKLADEMEKMRSQPPTLVEYTLYFGDWTDMDGITFPQRIQRAVAGTTQEEWVVSKVKVNPKIDPKKFVVEDVKE